MFDKKEKLERLNRYIKKGRVRFVLERALIFTIGISLIIFINNLVDGLIFSAWIVFAICYCISALWWSGFSDKAHQIVRELREGVAARENPSSPREYILSLIIFVSLFAPTLACIVSEQWFRWKPESFVQVNLSGEYGNKQKLFIPSSYLIDDVGRLYLKGLAGAIQPTVTLTATVDMNPVSYEEAEHINAYKSPIQNRSHLSPMENYSKLLQIELINSKHVYEQKIHQYALDLQPTDHGIIINLDDQKLKEEYGLKFENAGIFMYAYPVEETEGKLVIICQRVCSMFMPADSISMVNIIFNRDRLSEWKLIRTKAAMLIKGFSNEQHGG